MTKQLFKHLESKRKCFSLWASLPLSLFAKEKGAGTDTPAIEVNTKLGLV